MKKIDFSPIVRNTCGGFVCVCFEPFTYYCYYYKTCNKFGVLITLHFSSLLNVRLLIIRAIKTLRVVKMLITGALKWLDVTFTIWHHS
jgi:hypothetical protein